MMRFALSMCEPIAIDDRLFSIQGQHFAEVSAFVLVSILWQAKRLLCVLRSRPSRACGLKQKRKV
jgi:hypothetical protein